MFRYEYMSIQTPTEIGRFHHPDEVKLKELGWAHTWSDVTSEGTFYVFRRERPEFSQTPLADPTFGQGS